MSSLRLTAPRLSTAYAAVSLADTLLAGHASPVVRRGRWLTKPAAMPLLMAACRAATPNHAARGTLTRSVQVAQGLSGIGDVALLNPGDVGFLAGLSSFFGAHVAYVVGFGSAARPWSDPDGREGLAAAAVVFGVAGPAMAWAAGRENAALRGPVLAYAGVLSGMVATSTRLDPALDPVARRTIQAGTLLFLVSDTILSTRRFVLSRPKPRSDAAVMATYLAAQGLIAHGVTRAVTATG